MTIFLDSALLNSLIRQPMPLINVKLSSAQIANEGALLKELSAELATLTGKPEAYVMSLLQINVPMTFGGTEDPCCYIEVKSIGSLQPSQMTKSFCRIIESRTGVPANRIYIGFEDIAPSQWGFNSRTFG